MQRVLDTCWLFKGFKGFKGTKIKRSVVYVQGWTPLHSAVSSGQEKTVAALLQFGASPDTTNSGGQTALHYAVGAAMG